MTENKPAQEALESLEKINTDPAEEGKEPRVEEPTRPEEPVEEEVNNKTYSELKAERE